MGRVHVRGRRLPVPVSMYAGVEIFCTGSHRDAGPGMSPEIPSIELLNIPTRGTCRRPTNRRSSSSALYLAVHPL